MILAGAAAAQMTSALPSIRFSMGQPILPITIIRPSIEPLSSSFIPTLIAMPAPIAASAGITVLPVLPKPLLSMVPSIRVLAAAEAPAKPIRENARELDALFDGRSAARKPVVECLDSCQSLNLPERDLENEIGAY